MGSHYIPVGKIKIDKEILDIACPAAGYDETPPPPEIYCPANGYILEPGAKFVPPVETDDPTAEQIWLLCQNAGTGHFGITVHLTGGQWYIDFYDAGDNLLETSIMRNSSQYIDMDITHLVGNNEYFIAKVKLTNPTTDSITRFHIRSNYNFGGTNYPILQAKINTPNVTNLTGCFNGVKMLRDVLFISSVDYLENLSYFLANSGITYWKPDKNFSAVLDASYCFDNSDITKLDLSGSTFPLVTNMTRFCYRTSSLYKCILPESFPELLNASYFFEESGIEKLTMFTSASKVTDYSRFVYNAKKLKGELIFPESLDCTTISYMAYSAFNLTSIILTGNWTSLYNMINAFQNCYKVKYLELPRTVYNSSLINNVVLSNICSNMYDLDEIVVPDIFHSLSSIYNAGLSPSLGASKMLRVYRGNSYNPNIPDSNVPTLDVFPNLQILNLPQAINDFVKIGSSTIKCPKLNEATLDWANYPDRPNTSSPDIAFYTNFDATELNRIMTLLPTVTNGQIIDFRQCPGFSTANYSIAQAKGWTVWGA